MNSHFLVGILGAFAGLSIASAPLVAGPISYTTQARSVFAELREGVPTPEGQDNQIDTDTAAAPDFGVFNSAVSASVGGTGFSNASQLSTLGADGMSSSGQLRGRTQHLDSSYRAETKFTTDFVLDTPRNYLLAISATAAIAPLHTIDTIRFERLDVPTTLATIDIDFPDFAEFNESASGFIPAGTYRATLDLRLGTDQSMTLDYDFNLTFTEGPTVIPLPPAMWAGLATLAGMGLIHARRIRARD